MNILMTGVTGFIGGFVERCLTDTQEHQLTSVSRKPINSQSVKIRSIDEFTDWTSILNNIHCVIHAAARAHIMRDEVADPLAEYRRVNTEGTLALAQQAAKAGVKRFIFISSIKVNGEKTSPGTSFSEDDLPAPKDAYGISKYEAEQGLLELAAETGMEVVIIRPPLVYGPGVKGNFAAMIRLVDKGIPLPFGAVYNQRSLVAVDNLVDLIITCIDHPAAAHQVFLAGDGQDLSTTELLQGVGQAMGKPARLIPVPSGLLTMAATLLGKKAMAERLLGSLQVDISKAQKLLGWQPPVSVEEGLKRCFASSSRHDNQ